MALPRPSPWLTLVIAMLSLMAVLWAESTHSATADAQATSALTNRVTSLEAHQMDDTARLKHIQDQLDWLISWAVSRK